MSSNVRCALGSNLPLSGAVTSPALRQPKKQSQVAAHNIVASKPFLLCQFFFSCSISSGDMGSLTLSLHPFSALTLLMPLSTCPSLGMLPHWGSGQPLLIWAYLTPARYDRTVAHPLPVTLRTCIGPVLKQVRGYFPSLSTISHILPTLMHNGVCYAFLE